MEKVLEKLRSKGGTCKSVRAVCSGWRDMHDSTRTSLLLAPGRFDFDRNEWKPFIGGAGGDHDLQDGEDAPKSSAWAKARAKAAKLAAPSVVSLVRRFPHLELLALKGERFTDDDGRFATQLLPKLFVQTALDGFIRLGSTATLTVLRLQACLVSLDAMKQLSNLPSLTSLDFARSFLPGHFGCCNRFPAGGLISPRQMMNTLGKLTGLRQLSLEDFGFYIAEGGGGPCHTIQLGEGVQYLSTLTALRSLNLKCSAGFTRAGLRTLCTMSSLTELNLRGCMASVWNSGSDGMLTLSGLTALTSLNLKDTTSMVNAVSDAELEVLSRLTALKTLRVADTEEGSEVGARSFDTGTATKAGVEAMSTRLTNLTNLNVDGWLNDQAMRALHSIPALHALCVADKPDPAAFDWLA
jgi:hypothetical protein